VNEATPFCQMMAETDPFSETWVLRETQNNGLCLKYYVFYCNTQSKQHWGLMHGDIVALSRPYPSVVDIARQLLHGIKYVTTET
jgi:hypothetical protein